MDSRFDSQFLLEEEETRALTEVKTEPVKATKPTAFKGLDFTGYVYQGKSYGL